MKITTESKFNYRERDSIKSINKKKQSVRIVVARLQWTWTLVIGACCESIFGEVQNLVKIWKTPIVCIAEQYFRNFVAIWKSKKINTETKICIG